MIDVRPISDLKDKYAEIKDDVLNENKTIYLTEDGHETMVIMSTEKYSKLVSETEYNEYIENMLDEADKEAEDKEAKYYTHEQMKKITRGIIDEE